MKNLSPIAYRVLFFKHLWRFLRSVTTPEELLLPQAVAVSGGRDSMTLLWVASSLHKQGKLGPVRAIFVHHHTREGQDDDAEVIRKFCEEENIGFTMLHIRGLTTFEGNFEARARKMRRNLVLQNLKKDELLWVGHHLDDSYEWNFMQRSRSYNPKASLGIPVRNGPIVRPFNCVTRQQITKLARFEGIPFNNDPTNEEIRYDRNYVRKLIIPRIRKRNPKYLKFYAHHSNFMAMLLKVSVLNRTGASQIFVFEQGAAIVGKHFEEIKIQELIHNYSNADRGEIITPIQRMLRAIENGKKGPFQFSGGIEAYFSYNLLMIYTRNFRNYDASIANVLSHLSDNQLREMPVYKRIELQQTWDNLLKSSDAMLNLPGLILVLESQSVCKTLNCSVYDPLFPMVSEICKRRGLRFITYSKCIELWMAKKEKLPEKLRLLPLSNLSNLFASQQ